MMVRGLTPGQLQPGWRLLPLSPMGQRTLLAAPHHAELLGAPMGTEFSQE